MHCTDTSGLGTSCGIWGLSTVSSEANGVFSRPSAKNRPGMDQISQEQNPQLGHGGIAVSAPLDEVQASWVENGPVVWVGIDQHPSLAAV